MATGQIVIDGNKVFAEMVIKVKIKNKNKMMLKKYFLHAMLWILCKVLKTGIDVESGE